MIIKSIFVALMLVGSLFVMPVSATTLSAGVSDDFENTGYFNNRITYLTFDGVTSIESVQGGVDQVSNGGGEDGATDWIAGFSSTDDAHTGDRSLLIWTFGDGVGHAIYQDVDLTGVNTLSFYEKVTGVGGDANIYVKVSGTQVFTQPLGTVTNHDWTLRKIDVSGYTGVKTLAFGVYVTGAEGDIHWWMDDIQAYTGDLVDQEVIATPTHSGVIVDNEHLYYFGTLASEDSIEWVDGVPYIDDIATSNFVGSMPMLPVGQSGTITLDTDLTGVYDYSPKKCTVDYTNADNGDVGVTVQLTDVDFNIIDQPEQTKITLLTDTGVQFNEQVGSSTSFTIPNVPDGDYDLEVSFYDYEFGGWSNVKLFTLSVFGNAVTVDDVDTGAVLGDADNIISGVQDAFADENDGIMKMATRGWLRFDLFNSLLTGIADMLGFDLVTWSEGGAL